MRTSTGLLPGGRHPSPAAALGMRLGHPVLRGLLGWIHDMVNKHEEVELYPWIGDYWYVVVKDTRVSESPENMLCGFTVNIWSDMIFWSNDFTRQDLKHGGNCFFRSDRWWRLIRREFPEVATKRDGVGMMKDYRRKRRKS